MQDFRRINVGLTRARKKMIVVGSSQLANYEKSKFLYELYYWIGQQGKILGEVPKIHLEEELNAVEKAYLEIFKEAN